MVQTYEGALTETDSILQRMKTLADQAANGTYQDDVDRDAIQLEFDQLNDELNQIADTDFNGVVVLNGGEMADGTKAVNGKFDYANRVRNAKQLTAADINVLDYQIFDDKSAKTGNANVGPKIADEVWNTIGGWNRGDADHTNDGPDEVDVTLKYNATSNTWSVESASNGADKSKFSLVNAAGANQTKNDGKMNGGFTLSDGTNNIANVVLDQTSLVDGDTITLTLKNPKADIAAPTNISVDSKSVENTLAGATSATHKNPDDYNLKVQLDATNITDANQDATLNAILDSLQGATIKATYTATAKDPTFSIDLNNGSATITAGGAVTLKDGTQLKVDITNNVIKIQNAAGDKDYVTLTATQQATAADEHAGTVTYKLGLDKNAYDTSKTPTVEVKDLDTAAVSKSDAFGQATAPLTYTDHIILQSGARTKDAVDFTFKYSSGGMGDLKANMNCSSREDGLNTANLSLRTAKEANYAIDRIDNAINKVSMVRATFGAVQNRLEHKIDNMNVTKENMTSAESRIRDTNMAEEMTNFTKNQILAQASQAMLAQANQLPQGVLQLLG